MNDNSGEKKKMKGNQEEEDLCSHIKNQLC